VIGNQRRGNAVNSQQLGSDAGVFTGDDVGLAQGVQSPQGNVGGVADGRGDDDKALSQRSPGLLFLGPPRRFTPALLFLGRFTPAPAMIRLRRQSVLINTRGSTRR